MRATKEEIARARRIASRYVAQFDTPYESTKAFHRFLKKHGCFKKDRSYMDIGAGFGCVTAHMAEHEPQSQFLAVDYNPACIEIGARAIRSHHIPNLTIEEGDWFDLPRSMKGTFDGIFNNHTLCALHRPVRDSIGALTALKPRWVAFNSLFWDGYMDVFIQTRDARKPSTRFPDSDLNIYSLPMVKRVLQQQGYSRVHVEPFTITVDLPKPKDGQRGTYTVRTEWNKRSQFSGPVYLPWHFVLAVRSS